LSGGIIRELNGFVDRWEMNEGREKTNPMKPPRQNVYLINILIDVISNESILNRFNTFNCYGNVHNDSNKTEAE